jgi:hypothetical protein
MFGLPSLTPRAFAAASAAFVRPAMSAHSFTEVRAPWHDAINQAGEAGEANREAKGLRPDDVEAGIAKFCRELAECLERLRLPEKFHVGFVIAAGDILREKLVEFQMRGIGRA